MATYLPGMTDYIPQMQSFSPDFNFLGNILQTKQSKYDAAHKKLSGLYGSLLNAPLTRDSNIAKRDELFKAIDTDIKKLSGLDLSLQQNVEFARNVFTPLVEDKSILKDMTWTKNYMDQVQRGESFRLCTDPAKCGGSYWNAGMAELNYRRQEFKNASEEEAMNFSDVKYTPAINIMDEATAKLKDMGFKVKYDEVKNGYIVTSINSDKTLGTFQDFLVSMYGSDQRVLDYYNTMAYTGRKSWVEQNLDQYGGDPTAAGNAYVKEQLAKTKEHIVGEKKAAEKKQSIANDKREALNNVAQSGVAEGDVNYAKIWNQTISDLEQADANVSVATDAESAVKATELNVGNGSTFDASLDRQVAYSMMYKELGNAALVYQQLTQEKELKADPYGVQAQAHRNAMSKLYIEKGSIDPLTGEYKPGLDARNYEYKMQAKVAAEKKSLNYLVQYDPRFSSVAVGGGARTSGGTTAFGGGGVQGAPLTTADLLNVSQKLGDAATLGTATPALEDYAYKLNKGKVSEVYVQSGLVQQKLAKSFIGEARAGARRGEAGYATILQTIFEAAGVDVDIDAYVAGDEDELNKLSNLTDSQARTISKTVRDLYGPAGAASGRRGALSAAMSGAGTNYIAQNLMGDFWLQYNNEYVAALKADRDFEYIHKLVKDESARTAVAIKTQLGLRTDDDGNYILDDREYEAGSQFMGTAGKEGTPIWRTPHVPEREALKRTAFMAKQNELKGDLVEYLVANSKLGVFPDAKEALSLIKKWASTDPSKGSPSLFYKLDPDKYGKPDEFTPQTAEQFAREYLPGLEKVFRTQYKNFSKAWKSHPQLATAFGDQGEASNMSTLDYDMNQDDNPNNIAVMDYLSNWMRSSEKAAQFHNLSKDMTGKETDASQLAQNYVDYLFKSRYLKPGERPAGNFDYTDIAFNSLDHVSATITPDRDWLKQESVKLGVEKGLRDAWVNERHKPINLVLPREEADNIFTRGAEHSINDIRMVHGENIVVDYFPNAGKTNIMLKENGYNIVFDILKADENGRLVPETWEQFEPVSMTMNPDIIEQVIEDFMRDLELANLEAISEAKNKGRRGTGDEVSQDLVDNYMNQNNARRLN